MTAPESQAEAERQALERKWFYRFQLPGGGRTESYLPADVLPIHETRERMVFSVLDPVFGNRWGRTTCIDLACHEGYYGACVAQRGCKSVLGVDARAANLAGANLMRVALGLKNISFQQADVSTLDPARFGRFDIVLVLGLIYHLEDPIGALRLARALCNEVALIETQLAPELGGEIEFGSRHYIKKIMGTWVAVDEESDVAADNREANLTTVSLVPSRQALLWTLRAVGFSRAEVVAPHPGAYEQLARGQRALVAAWI
jgi:hypothetical protein